MTDFLDFIIDDARWAPSGHNTQPWRFKKIPPNILDIYVQSEENVLNLGDNETAILCVGMMLENIILSANHKGKSVEWTIQDSTDAKKPVIRVKFMDSLDIASSEDNRLYQRIRTRSVDRRSYKYKPLSNEDKKALEKALGSTLKVDWFESLKERYSMARLAMGATHIRLSIKETFSVHQEVVEWQKKDSADKIPAHSLGLDPLTLMISKFFSKSRKRQEFINKVPGGLFLYQWETDICPGIACAGYFMLSLSCPIAVGKAEKISQLLEAGMVVQKFWLTADLLGLALSPNHMLLVFSDYIRKEIEFTKDTHELENAKKLSQRFEAYIRKKFNLQPEKVLLMGRVGSPRERRGLPRSIRLSAENLLITEMR
ncbi:MAG: hypothetical protein KDJ50_03770 [Alphaproteobacteria bacterium]|nr:hypothetical protein [Alphaproteobacteria bacterium]